MLRSNEYIGPMWWFIHKVHFFVLNTQTHRTQSSKLEHLDIFKLEHFNCIYLTFFQPSLRVDNRILAETGRIIGVKNGAYMSHETVVFSSIIHESTYSAKRKLIFSWQFLQFSNEIHIALQLKVVEQKSCSKHFYMSPCVDVSSLRWYFVQTKKNKGHPLYGHIVPVSFFF